MSDNELSYEDLRKLEMLHEMFQSEAWTILSEAIEQTRRALTDIRGIESAEKLYFNKGKLTMLDELAQYPHMVKGQLDNA